MLPPTLRILALEPDEARGRRLLQMVAQHTGADVLVVPTVEAAIASLASRMPDAILTSALLPPQAEAGLHGHLKTHDEHGRLPVVMVPPINESAEAPVPRRGLLALGRLRRHAVEPPASYDAAAITTRILYAIAEARRLHHEHLQRLAETASEEPRMESAVSVVKSDAGSNVRRFRSPRCAPGEIGWLTGARTAYGLPIRVVNISDSGLLLEAADKMASGTATEIELYGPETTIIIPSRVVRVEVSAVTPRGVRYQMAAVFDRKLDAVRAGNDREWPASPRALADLLAQVSSEIESGRGPDAVRTAFERGLQQLVPARDIRLCSSPEPSENSGDAVCFRVPTATGAPALLQVTFEPDYQPAAREFTLLKASAVAAGILLFYQQQQPAGCLDYFATAARGSGIGGG